MIWQYLLILTILRTDGIKFTTDGIKLLYTPYVSIMCTNIMVPDDEEDEVDTTEREEEETNSDVVLVLKGK